MNKNFMSGLEHYIHGNPKFNSRIPFYNDDSDYTTNAPSYYDDLARKNKLMKVLALRIWEYEEEMIRRLEQWDKNLEDFPDDVKKLLEKWLEDGTLDHIINDTIFSWKLDTEIFNELRIDIYNKDHGTTKERIDYREHRVKDIMLNVKDYSVVGNGTTNDSNAIDKMLKQVPSYSTVYFPDGEYPIDKIIINKPVKIIMSKNASFKSLHGKESLDISGLIQVDSSDVELNGITINGNKDTIRGIKVNESETTLKNIYLKNITVYDTNMVGIWVDNVESLYMENIYTKNIDINSDGLSGSIRVENCFKGTIKDIKIDDSKGKGIALKLCYNMKVSNVTVNRSRELQPSFYLNDSHYIYCDNIQVFDGDENGVKFSRGATHCYINGGYFESKATTRDRGGYTLILQGNSHCKVENVDIHSTNNFNAIRIEDHPDPEGANSIGNIIKDCSVFYDGLGPSISVRTRPDQSSYIDKENILDGLTVDGGDVGISCNETSYLTIKNCVLMNIVNRGIQVNNTDHVTVKDNVLKSIQEDGITLFNSNYYTVENNNIQSNNTGNNGINLVADTSHGKIINNIIIGFALRGIRITVLNNGICLNNVISGGQEGISLSSSENVVLENNDITNVEEYSIRLNNNEQVKIIKNTLIESNGGAINSFSSKDLTLRDNTITGNNTFDYGVLIGSDNVSVKLFNNTISGYVREQVRSASGLIDGTLSGNTITGGLYPIYFDSTNKRIRIFGNSFSGGENPIFISEEIVDLYNEGNF